MNTSTPGDRLRKLRIDAKFDTAYDAARRFGWNLNTYSAHEIGARGISAKAAKEYAAKFKTSPEYILYGTGSGGQYGVDLIGQLTAFTHEIELYEPDQVQPVPCPMASTPATACVLAPPDIGGGIEDAHLFFEDTRQLPQPFRAGRLYVVMPKSGPLAIRRLMPGRADGKADAVWLTGRIEADIDIEWAAPVLWVRFL